MVRPAAMAWPPPASSRPSSKAAWTARPRLTPGCERPEPLPMSAARSRPITTTGRAVALAQPAGDDADHARMPALRAPRRWPARRDRNCCPRSMTATAASTICVLDVLALGVERVELLRPASAPRRDRRWTSSRAPRSERPMRPPALIRGPRMKPAWKTPAGALGRRRPSISAVRPGLAQPDITFRPWAARARLKPTSWVTSQMAPRAARSSQWRRSGSGAVGEQAAAARLAVQRRQQHEGDAGGGQHALARGAVGPVRD